MIKVPSKLKKYVITAKRPDGTRLINSNNESRWGRCQVVLPIKAILEQQCPRARGPLTIFGHSMEFATETKGRAVMYDIS